MTVSSFGDQFYLIALPWIVLLKTGSSWVLGTILMATAIPRSALMLVGGAVTDRVSARRIMIATTVSRTLLVAAVGGLIWSNRLRVFHLYILASLFGVSDAFAIPALQAIMPALVSDEQLAPANALLQGAIRTATMVGPGPAGWVIKVWGAAYAMFIDAISFLFVILALSNVPDPSHSKNRLPSTMTAAIREGLAYVAHDSAMRSLMLLLCVLNLFLTGTISIGLATLAKDRFASVAVYGVWMSAFSAGALAGTAIGGFIQRYRGYVLVAIVGLLGLCLCGITLLVAWPVLAGVVATMGIGIGIVNTALPAWFQARVERPFLGRVSSVLAFCASGLLPISFGLAGALARANVGRLFLVAGTSIILVSVIAGASRGVRAIN
jgi:MFS family permease